ncbi:MAG: hypothetical protein IK104_01075 [Clostridia bacterium]|nr:hypothetical protein [Clostridia bacterium]
MSTINNTGANALTYIFTLIKNKFVQKVYKTGSSSVYKTLSDNDLTDALKAQYDAAYAHSQAAHAPSTAQANVIESVKVNGTALIPINKAVNVNVPTAVSDLTNDEGYIDQAKHVVEATVDTSVEPNTVTITETIANILAAKEAGYEVVLSGTMYGSINFELPLRIVFGSGSSLYFSGVVPYGSAGDSLLSVEIDSTLTGVLQQARTDNVLHDDDLDGYATEEYVDEAIPTVPVISTDISSDAASDAKTASPKAVKTYVDSAIGGIAGFSFRILTSGEYNASGVPTVTGETNKIYLVPLSETATNNIYAEWIYVNNGFERIGQTSMDLSGYVKETDIVELTNAQIQTIWDNVLSA